MQSNEGCLPVEFFGQGDVVTARAKGCKIQLLYKDRLLATREDLVHKPYLLQDSWVLNSLYVLPWPGPGKTS